MFRIVLFLALVFSLGAVNTQSVLVVDTESECPVNAQEGIICIAKDTKSKRVFVGGSFEAIGRGGGGPNTGRWQYINSKDAAGFLCTNCPLAGIEFFPIVLANMGQTTSVRVVAFCDLACNASTVVEVIDDANNAVIASVAGPNAADTAEAGICTPEILSGDIKTKVRIKGSGAAADDYQITYVALEAC